MSAGSIEILAEACERWERNQFTSQLRLIGSSRPSAQIMPVPVGWCSKRYTSRLVVRRQIEWFIEVNSMVRRPYGYPRRIKQKENPPGAPLKMVKARGRMRHLGLSGLDHAVERRLVQNQYAHHSTPGRCERSGSTGEVSVRPYSYIPSLTALRLPQLASPLSRYLLTQSLAGGPILLYSVSKMPPKSSPDHRDHPDKTFVSSFVYDMGT